MITLKWVEKLESSNFFNVFTYSKLRHWDKLKVENFESWNRPKIHNWNCNQSLNFENWNQVRIYRLGNSFENWLIVKLELWKLTQVDLSKNETNWNLEFWKLGTIVDWQIRTRLKISSFKNRTKFKLSKFENLKIPVIPNNIQITFFLNFTYT